jgi:hypothetical protein
MMTILEVPCHKGPSFLELYLHLLAEPSFVLGFKGHKDEFYKVLGDLGQHQC